MRRLSWRRWGVAALVLALAASVVGLARWRRRGGGTRPAARAALHVIAGRVLDRVGRPIGGARLSAWAFGGVVRVAASDGEGRYRLELATGAAVRLRAEAAGFAAVELERVEPAQAGLELTMVRTLALDGVVRAHGRPAAGVEVTVGGPSGLRTLASGPDGAFTVASLAEGRYAVRAGRAGEAAFVDGVVVSADADGGSGLLLLELAPATTVTARVRDRGGRAIAGAEVTLTEADGTPLPRSQHSDEEGGVRFEAVLPGGYLVDARAEGYYPAAPRPLRVAATPLTAATLELRLERGGVISGRVVDERGAPVAGAQLEVAGEAPDGTPVAVTQASAGASAAAAGQLEAAGELGVLHGPIPYPPLTAPAPPGPELPTASAAKMFVSDGNGDFRVVGLPAGTLVVAASHPDFARGAAEPVQLGAGGEATVTVTLARGVRLGGRVSDERGQPIAGAEIFGDDGATLTVTDGRGEYALAHVAHALQLTARAAGYLPASRAAAPDERGPFDLTLRRAEGRLAGDVVDDRGAPIAAARVEIASPDAPAPPRGRAPAARWFTTDGAGRFHADALGPGPFRVSVSHGDFAPGSFDAVPAGEEAHFVLGPGGGVEGDLRDGRSGDVPAGARLELTPAGGKPRPLTLVRGHFSAGAVPPGRARLAASAPGYVAYEQLVDVPAGERPREVTVRDLRVELQRGGRVAGQLRDDRGDPLAGVVVTVTPGDGPAVRARTDRDGRFVADGIAPGRAVVTAEPPGHGAAADRVDVRENDEAQLDLRSR